MLSFNEIDKYQWKALEEVFFTCSGITNFSSAEAKRSFLYKYFEIYKKKYPEYFYAYFEGNFGGYICGMKDTWVDTEYLQLHKYYNEFFEHIQTYPAHLHINIHENLQGKGIGKKLVERFLDNINTNVHIITSPNSGNRKFYNKIGFSFEEIKAFNGQELLFMGKNIC